MLEDSRGGRGVIVPILVGGMGIGMMTEKETEIRTGIGIGEGKETIDMIAPRVLVEYGLLLLLQAHKDSSPRRMHFGLCSGRWIKIVSLHIFPYRCQTKQIGMEDLRGGRVQDVVTGRDRSQRSRWCRHSEDIPVYFHLNHKLISS